MTKRLVRIDFGAGEPFWGNAKELSDKLTTTHGTDGAFALMEKIAPYADAVAKITVSNKAKRSAKVRRPKRQPTPKSAFIIEMRAARVARYSFKEWLEAAIAGSVDRLSIARVLVKGEERYVIDFDMSWPEWEQTRKPVARSTLYGWWTEAGKKKRRE
jgi:hypothetical protein